MENGKGKSSRESENLWLKFQLTLVIIMLIFSGLATWLMWKRCFERRRFVHAWLPLSYNFYFIFWSPTSPTQMEHHIQNFQRETFLDPDHKLKNFVFIQTKLMTVGYSCVKNQLCRTSCFGLNVYKRRNVVSNNFVLATCVLFSEWTKWNKKKIKWKFFQILWKCICLKINQCIHVSFHFFQINE